MEVTKTYFLWNGVQFMLRYVDLSKVVFPVEVSSKPVNLLTIPTARRTSLHYMKCRPEQPLAPEHRDKPGASSYQQGNQEKQRGDVKRAGVQ
jgi:hypothetical protein